jgi:hypothetical protein
MSPKPILEVVTDEEIADTDFMAVARRCQAKSKFLHAADAPIREATFLAYEEIVERSGKPKSPEAALKAVRVLLATEEYGARDLVSDPCTTTDIKGWVREKMGLNSGGTLATTGRKEGGLAKVFYWGEDEAAVSWAVASSALFSPFAKASEVSANGVPMRPYLTEHKVATWAGGEQMIYTGQVLAQSDHDVWMELMRLAVEQNGHDLIFNENPNTTPIDDRPSVPVRFSGLEMLRLLGRANHGKEHSRLGESLFRLSTSVLDFKVERGGVELSSSGAMLQAVRRLGEKKKRRTKKKDGTVMMVDVETGDYQVWISMDCVRLWGTGATTFKKALREGLSPTAQWLHLFVLRQDCREGPAARFVSESKLFRVMGVHLAHADNGAQSSLSSQRKARENRRNKVAKAMTELVENGVLTAVGKKRRNKNGRLVYAWWFSKRGASGDIIYSLGFIPAPGQQLTLPGL